MSNKQKSLQNLIWSAVGQIVTIAFGLLLPRLFIVGYGSEVNGLLTSLRQFLVCLNLFEAGVGNASRQSLYGPIARNDWHAVSGIISATDRYYRRTGRWYFTALVALSLCFPLIVNSELSPFTIMGAVFFSGIGNVVVFYLQGKYRLLLEADGRSYIVTNLTTVITILTDFSKIILIYFGADIVLILAVSFLIQTIQAVYILWYVKKRYTLLEKNSEPNYQAVSQKNYALLHQISWLIFSNTDVMILTVVCGLRVVSVYSMFKLVTSQLESLLGILINSVGFVFGQDMQTDLQKFVRRLDLFESYYSGMTYALFSVAFFLFLPFIRLYTAGVTDIFYADPVLPVMFVAISLLNLSRQPMANTITAYAGQFKESLPQTIAENVINLCVSLFGVYRWGIYGVLIGTIIALLYRTNEQIIYTNTKILRRKPWRTYQIYFVNIGLFFFTQVIFRRLFTEPVTYPQFFVTGVLAAFLSVCVFTVGQSVLLPHCRTALAAIWKNYLRQFKK